MNIEQQSQYKVLFTDNKRQFWTIYSLPYLTSSMFRTFPYETGTFQAGQPPDGETDTATSSIHQRYPIKTTITPFIASIHAALHHPKQSCISYRAKSRPPAF